MKENLLKDKYGSEKVGDLNYVSDGVEYKTEIRVCKKAKTFLNKESCALTCLIPNAWLWYECLLFDELDDGECGIPSKKYGKEFVMIYNEIVTEIKADLEDVKEKGFKDDVDFGDISIFSSGYQEEIRGTSKDGKKLFWVRSVVLSREDYER